MSQAGKVLLLDASRQTLFEPHLADLAAGSLDAIRIINAVPPVALASLVDKMRAEGPTTSDRPRGAAPESAIVESPRDRELTAFIATTLRRFAMTDFSSHVEIIPTISTPASELDLGEELPHIDSVEELYDDRSSPMALIEFIVHLEVPSLGGELVLYDLILKRHVFEALRGEDPGLAWTMAGAPNEVLRPAAGEIILFDSQRLHGIRAVRGRSAALALRGRFLLPRILPTRTPH